MAPDEEPSEREQRVVQMLQRAAATERAPASLRAELDAMRSGGGRARRTAGLPRRRPAWASPGGQLRLAMVSILPVAAALAVLLVVVIGGGNPITPSVAQAARLALRTPQSAGPAVDPTAPRLLTARVASLHFPNWESQGGWRSAGVRTDEVASHAVTTVYYRHAGEQIAYSIAARPALSGSRPPAGQHYRTFTQDGRTYVLWIESGHTCLLSSTTLSSDQMWSLVRGQTV